jgi:N-acetyl-anhydromuramyl-L-alanine amidase AmpD
VHYLIARDGKVDQLVPLNRCAWHSDGHNRDSIAVALVSFGPLVLRDGKFYSALHGPEVTDVHDGYPPSSNGYRYWHKFTDEQLARLGEIRALWPELELIALKNEQYAWPLALSEFQ